MVAVLPEPLLVLTIALVLLETGPPKVLLLPLIMVLLRPIGRAMTKAVFPFLLDPILITLRRVLIRPPMTPSLTLAFGPPLRVRQKVVKTPRRLLGSTFTLPLLIETTKRLLLLVSWYERRMQLRAHPAVPATRPSTIPATVLSLTTVEKLLVGQLILSWVFPRRKAGLNCLMIVRTSPETPRNWKRISSFPRRIPPKLSNRPISARSCRVPSLTMPRARPTVLLLPISLSTPRYRLPRPLSGLTTSAIGAWTLRVTTAKNRSSVLCTLRLSPLLRRLSLLRRWCPLSPISDRAQS